MGNAEYTIEQKLIQYGFYYKERLSQKEITKILEGVTYQNRGNTYLKDGLPLAPDDLKNMLEKKLKDMYPFKEIKVTEAHDGCGIIFGSMSVYVKK